FFKAVFSDPAQAGGLLRALLPAVAERIDWATLAPAPANFVNAVLRQRLGDLVFHARLCGGGEVLVWFLVEHQSTEDWWMAHRVAELELAMWGQWRLSNRRARAVPAIIPVVVYHGAQRWRAPTDTAALCELPEPAAALSDHVMRCPFVLDDLTAMDDAALRARHLDALATLALLALVHGAAEDFAERLAAAWTHELRTLLRDGPSEAAVVFFLYLMHANPRNDPEALARVIVPVAGDDAEETIMSAAQRLIQQGFEKGHVEGRVAGQAEGRVEGQRLMLQRLLEQ